MNEEQLVGKRIYTYNDGGGYFIDILEVISFHQYGDSQSSNWYIEGYGKIFGRGYSYPREYFYWKQAVDGGGIIDLEKNERIA